MALSGEERDMHTHRKSSSQRSLPAFFRWIRKRMSGGISRVHDLVRIGNHGNFNFRDTCFQSRKIPRLSRDEQFYLSLYSEGLLKHNVLMDDEGGDIRSVVIIYQFPVLNIGYEFDDSELVSYDNYNNANSLTADFRYTNDPNPWVRTGLDKVFAGSRRRSEEEPRVDGLPASMWIDIMEPVLQTMLMMKKLGRCNRTNITKHKKPSPLHRNRRVVVGDVQQTYFMVGPHMNGAGFRAGIMAMFAHRLAELGERAWRRDQRYTRSPQSDRTIPFLREHRESTRNRPPKQETVPARKPHRSKSTSELNLSYMGSSNQETDLDDIEDATYDNAARIERNGYMVFH